MKKLKSFTLLLFTCLLIATISCKNDSEPGPTGPQGQQGIAGPAGLPGSQIYNGSGAPAAALGLAGDYYVDKDNAEMYGPKTTTGWGPAVVLKGADGATGPQGASGSKILSGDNAPATSLGAEGDFYFDKINATMYGPKAGSSWGTGTALRIGKVISYVVTRSSLMTWNTSHVFDIGNSTIPVPQDIKNNGIVLGYIVVRGTLTTDTWHQIPGHLFTANPAVEYYFIGMRIAPTYIRIHALEADGSSLPSGTNPPLPEKLRIVMIPADEINSVSRKGSPVDYSDYEAVKAYYNLKD